jgi:hypothetical protein
VVCASIQERARLGEGRDQILRPDDPADTPTRQTPILGSDETVSKVVRKAQRSELLYLSQAVDDDDRILGNNGVRMGEFKFLFRFGR